MKFKINFTNSRKQFTYSLLLVLFFSVLTSSFQQKKFDPSDSTETNKINMISSSGEEFLFQGVEAALNVTEYGMLIKENQEVQVSNQEEVNLTYYLDTDHDWKVNKIQTSVNNILDTREWVDQRDFTEVISYQQTVSESNIPDKAPPQHNYDENLESDPTNPDNIHNNLTQANALYMRVHFTRFEVETNYDAVCFYDNNFVLQYFEMGNMIDFYSPWIMGDTILITMDTDGSVNWYGYDIDYYEFLNASSYNFDSIDSWGHENNGTVQVNYGPGIKDQNSAMYLSLLGQPYRRTDTSFAVFYHNMNYTEIYQNLTIPRGIVKDAYISFDYYAESAMKTNELYLYYEINNQKIYSIGFRDIVSAGRETWHSSGKINMDLWVNTSDIFDGVINEKSLNISVGIMSGAGLSYSGFEDKFQQIIWLDNISLSLTTIANSSQEGINLKINDINLNQGEDWGTAYLDLTGNWDNNPVILTLNTTASDLVLTMNTSLFGYHKTKTRISQSSDEGINYHILNNGTVIWNFLHNFYMPTEYFNFSFKVFKPTEWKIKTILDPTLQQRNFDYGKFGDKVVIINETNAIFPGWWTITATSPNYINLSNTLLCKEGNWDASCFDTGDSTRIKTQINYSNNIPNNLEFTQVNLTIYDPDGFEWFSETKIPLSNGTVFFSEIFFDASNTTGGEYSFELFWSNGTSLGGLNSSFLIMHNSLLTLLKPDDSILDFQTDAFVGDIIPVRLNLSDAENGNLISNALITYNWTDGTRIIEEAALGIYETILFTSDLISNGFYEILIQSSKIGYLNYNFTLKINLGEETRLTRLQSDYDIELHDNSTIKFRYFSEITGGIDGATVNVNITSSNFYFIKNTIGGYYDIEFNSSFIDELGTYQLNFNLSAPSYETQTHIYQFRIIEQSTSIIARVDNQQVTQNSIIDVIYNEEIYVSARALAIIDDEFLSGGNFTWSINSNQEDLIENGDYWYNASIQINPSIFSLGLNLLKLQFEKEKYQTETFYFQLLVNAQPVELSAYVDAVEISEDQLIEVMFKQTIIFSLRAYGTVDLTYIAGAQVHWNSKFYSKQISESPSNWYNLSVTFTASNFSSGTNSVSIRFEKDNYTTTFFSFQLLIREQVVELNATINNGVINENEPIEVMLKENVTISAQAFAIGELIFLSGGNITLLSESFQIKLIETQPTWFAVEFIIDGAYFDLGINTLSLKFEQENYTESYFAFQFFITAETVNLSLYVNSEEILTNNLIQVAYFEVFSISLRAIANAEEILLNGGNATFVVGDYHQDFIGYTNFWYNTTITCDPSNFELGINTIRINFEHPNYTSSTFYFQVLVQQIEIKVQTINFQDSIETESGDDLMIRINLTEYVSTNYIDNATISYAWEFGLGTFEYLDNGIYQINLNIPENAQGSYKVSLIISTEDIVYKVTQASFYVVISPKELPDYMFLVVLIGSTVVIGILSTLSIRSYVIIPRKRKKEAELLSKTQNFKDLQNIQAIVIMHRYSGVPLYSKSYSILEKQKKELFAGFVQAITSIGEEIAGKKQSEEFIKKSKNQNLFELDFKYFHCLICDQEELRVVLVLAEKASDNLKDDISNLAAGIMLNIGDLIEKWDGALDTFEREIPPILNQYFNFQIKEPFILNSQEYLSRIRKEVELTKMETRILNTVTSMVKSQSSFLLDYIIETVHEDNKDLIIEAIKSLITKKIIVSTLE